MGAFEESSRLFSTYVIANHDEFMRYAISEARWLLLDDAHQAAEDAVQRVYATVWKRSQTCAFPTGEDFRRFCFVCIGNELLDVNRRRGVHRKHILRYLACVDECSSGAPADLEALLDLPELLDKLSADEQQMLRLHLHEYMDYRNIAEVLNVSLGTVANRMKAIIGKLRRMWRDDEKGRPV